MDKKCTECGLPCDNQRHPQCNALRMRIARMKDTDLLNRFRDLDKSDQQEFVQKNHKAMGQHLKANLSQFVKETSEAEESVGFIVRGPMLDSPDLEARCKHMTEQLQSLKESAR